MRQGDLGDSVRGLQQRLGINADGWYGPATEAAVRAFQAKSGLVQDGIAGPKTIDELSGRRDARTLCQGDMEVVAERLGVPVASVMAINEVESQGQGFLANGLPVVLFERHVMYHQLQEAGLDADGLSKRYPELINPQRGGYRARPQEWYRLGLAREINAPCANNSASWGAFQIMGYHWERLGYESQDDFVSSMATGEAYQLAAFRRFIEADPALHKALKARKWADFARLYNGPDYKTNLYDIKLQRAYERYSGTHPEHAPLETD